MSSLSGRAPTDKPTSIAVLLASHNGARYISGQLRTVLRQEAVNVQLLIGDDNSSDDTLAILRGHAVDSRVRLRAYRESAGGAGQSFLRLMRDADLDGHTHVAFCDQDDEWHVDKMSRAVNLLRDTGAALYSASVTAFWKGGAVRTLVQNDAVTDIDFLFEGAGQGCTFVFQGDFARSIQRFIREHDGLLRGIHYHDWFVYLAVRLMGGQWVFDPRPCMRYRQHDENDTGARSSLAGLWHRLKLVRRGWYRDQIVLMVAVAEFMDPLSVPEDFSAIWRMAPGMRRRLSLCKRLFRSGRRRASDRLVLSLSALMGWV